MTTRTLLLPLAWLRDRGACPDQVAMAEKAFGEPVPLTPAVIEAAVLAGLQVIWLTDGLTLAAWDEMERVRAAAYFEFIRVTAIAWAEHGQALAQYDRVMAAAYAAILSRRESWRSEVLAEWARYMEPAA